jgi:hypothetical protein
VAEAADDGESRQRRSSGEAWRSERRKRSRMGVHECKSESVRSLGTCFKLRRRHGERELLLTSQRARGAQGDGGTTWRGKERASAGRVSGGRGAGGHLAWRRAARGSWGSGKRPVKAAVGRREKQREGGAGGR